MRSFTTLIEPQELAPHLGASGWAVVDCRFDLANPPSGRKAWSIGHIPGAVYAHLEENLSGPVTPQTGRHPLPDPHKFAQQLGRWGIDNKSQVVVYDDATGAFAARLWWMLRWLGHPTVAVLNGGFKEWQRAGLPVDARVPSPRPVTFRPQPRDGEWLTTQQVQRDLANKSIVLIDARSADRFAGRDETIDPVAGHVPGARNHPFPSNLNEQGRFLAPEELRTRWSQTLQGAPGNQTVCMCGSGVTACHNLLALEVAGFTGARLYAGSWSEWIRDPARVQTDNGAARS